MEDLLVILFPFLKTTQQFSWDKGYNQDNQEKREKQ